MVSGSGSQRRSHAVDYVLSLGAVALMVIGFLWWGVCGAGVSFILFGSAIAVMGVVIARMGGAVILTASVLLVVTLVWGGILFASQSGCSL